MRVLRVREESIYNHRRLQEAGREAWSKPAILLRLLARQFHSRHDTIVYGSRGTPESGRVSYDIKQKLKIKKDLHAAVQD